MSMFVVKITRTYDTDYCMAFDNEHLSNMVVGLKGSRHSGARLIEVFELPVEIGVFRPELGWSPHE